MEELNWLIEIALCICLIALVHMKADVRAVIMTAAFYLAAVIREGKR
jgi:hypothetical protein